jgi:myo-inositol-1(or 4)-monophosphatase
MQRTAGLRRPGAQRWTWPTWLPATDGFFETGFNPGMWRRAPCWSPKPVAWSATSPATPTFWNRSECLAANPRIYGQLVSVLGKYSKFASAGDKAAVRQAVAELSQPASDDETRADVRRRIWPLDAAEVFRLNAHGLCRGPQVFVMRDR